MYFSIENVVTKCHGLLGTLARTTLYLPRQLLKHSYTAIIRSHLEYCSSLFTAAAKTHLKKLDTIQRTAARIIFQVPRDTHAEPLLILLNLEQLGDRRQRHLVKLMKSFVSGNRHPAVKHLVQPKPDGALSVPQSRTVNGKRRPGDRCYYIQSVVCLLLRLRGIMNPMSGLGELRKSTSSALDCANHICQRKMLVNAVHLLLYGKKKTTTTLKNLTRLKIDSYYTCVSQF